MLNTQPVAYSQRYYYRAFLRSNRFLGVPNPVVSAVVVLALGCTGWAMSELPLALYLSRYGLWLGAIALGIWGVMSSLTPGRSRLKRLAKSEHQAEVNRVARRHEVGISQVHTVDDEHEYQRALAGASAVSRCG